MTDTDIQRAWIGSTKLFIERDQINQQTHLWTDKPGQNHSSVRAWKSIPLEPTSEQVTNALSALRGHLQTPPPPPNVVTLDG